MLKLTFKRKSNYNDIVIWPEVTYIPGYTEATSLRWDGIYIFGCTEPIYLGPNGTYIPSYTRPISLEPNGTYNSNLDSIYTLGRIIFIFWQNLHCHSTFIISYYLLLSLLLEFLDNRIKHWYTFDILLFIRIIITFWYICYRLISLLSS